MEKWLEIHGRKEVNVNVQNFHQIKFYGSRVLLYAKG